MSEEKIVPPGPNQQTCAATASPLPVATISTSPAVCYNVRNGFAWAYIFVRHGVGRLHDGAPRGWVHVSVISDYGSFGYCWTHIGGGPWQEFLASLDMDYAMQKMLGERYRVPMSMDEAEEKGRSAILQYRREGSLDRSDARKLWDGLNDADRDYDLSSFLRSWDDHSGGRWYAHDWWDMSWDKVSPPAKGFWRDVWPHFIAAITDGASCASTTEASQSPGTNKTPSPKDIKP